jgi:hypothetical protein
MEKPQAIARALALLLAIISAFIAIPYATALLLILGAISSLSIAADEHVRVYMIAILLSFGSAALAAIPFVGPRLADIFANIDTVFIGISIAAITSALVIRVKKDWS